MDTTGIDGTPRRTVVSQSSLSPLRRSKRRQDTADEDSVERASRLTAKKNLENMEGNNYKNSLLSLSNEQCTAI